MSWLSSAFHLVSYNPVYYIYPSYSKVHNISLNIVNLYSTQALQTRNS